MPDDDGILRRWSARKSLARQRDVTGKTRRGGAAPEIDPRPPDAAEPAGEAAPAPPQDATSEPDDRKPGDPEATAAVIADLPDIAGLERESDFTPFLRQGVPESIQRLALRKLWRLDPTFAGLDGLVDYDDDFSDAALVVDGLKTAYKVGKGLLEDKPADEPVAEEDAGQPAERAEAPPLPAEPMSSGDAEPPVRTTLDDDPVGPEIPDDKA